MSPSPEFHALPLDDTLARARAKPAKSNTGPVAMEYYLAATAAREATARKELATKAAVTVGVLFDHKKDPRPPGTNEVVYDGAEVRITLKVATPSEKLDVTAFIAGLHKAEVKPALIARLLKRCTAPTAAAHTFTSALVHG
jgi:hypothetical protein